MINEEKKEKENIKEIVEKYSKVKFEIANLEMKKQELIEEDYNVSITPNYSGIPGGTGGVNDKVFNAIAKRENELEKIEKQIASKKAYCQMIENLVSTLNYKEQAIVKRRVFEHKDFYTISKELYSQDNIEIYDITWIKKLYRKSLDKMQGFYDSLV